MLRCFSDCTIKSKPVGGGAARGSKRQWCMCVVVVSHVELSLHAHCDTGRVHTLKNEGDLFQHAHPPAITHPCFAIEGRGQQPCPARTRPDPPNKPKKGVHCGHSNTCVDRQQLHGKPPIEPPAKGTTHAHTSCAHRTRCHHGLAVLMPVCLQKHACGCGGANCTP